MSHNEVDPSTRNWHSLVSPHRSALFLLLLLPLLYFLFPLISQPSGHGQIDALAPVEVVAERFREPTGVAVDQANAIFVSDRNSGDVFRIVGADIRPVATGLRKPVGLAFNGQGRLLIVEETRGRLLRLETDQRLTVLAERMRKPRWIGVEENGNVYLTAKAISSDGDDDDEEEEVGEVILRLTPQGGLTVWAEGFRALQGIVVRARAVFVVARGLRGGGDLDREGLFRIPILQDGRAGQISRFSQTEIRKPFGIAPDRPGAFYVSGDELRLDQRYDDVIAKVSSTGIATRFASNLREPRGVALDSSGNLLVADDRGGTNGRLLRFRAPSAPTVAVPQFTRLSPLTVNGTTQPNSRIDAFLNDSTTPIQVSTQAGSFPLTLNLALNTQNSLRVFTTTHNGQGLTSAPAEFTIVHDNLSPVISNLQPPSGSFLNNPRPQIRASFSDNLSGVDVSRVEIRLDGFNVTSQAQVTASGFTFTPVNPLSEGQHTVSVSIFDRAGNNSLATTTFTVDVTAPVISNLTPAHGSVVSTARPPIRADFSDNLSGINVSSVRILLDGADITFQATISATGFTFTPASSLSQGSHTVAVSLSDRAGNRASASSTFAVSLGPQLGRIGDRTVNLGETLSFTVSASNPGGGPLSLFVSPLPLPNHAAFNAATGLFTFTPDTTQVGKFQLTFSAVSGAQSVSETITITVPSPLPGGLTAVRGRIYNLNNTPLGNVRVTLKATGHTAFSTPDGFFTISGIPPGRQELIINGRAANLGVFAILAVPVDLIEGVLNNLPTPITLPDVDTDAEVQVSAVFTTIVSNPSVPGVALTILGGTARNPDGTLFTGKLSINPVPDYGRPESRPEELRPGMAITIQPAGVRFNPPARLTFPNADNMPAGSELNLWSLSPDTGTFNLMGKGVVTADRLSIITTEGGVSASAWHFFLASSPTPASSSSESRFCASSNCPGIGSEANLEEGSLYLTHALASYRSLGQSRSLSLTYSSVTADIRPIISLNTTLSVRAAVPNTFSTRLEVGGVQQAGEVFTDTRSLPEDSDSTSRLSAQFDASNLTTGRYPYQATIFSNYLNSSIGGITNSNVIVLNRKSSPLGSGWAITDLQQLFPQSAGALLTTGDGIALFFSGGPDTFTSPPGDFSILRRSADNTYTRTLKDGTKINFNAQGLQSSTIDRNNNTTSYSYDAQSRLLTITDPTGLITQFTYSGEKLQRITDPAGKVTLFQHDTSGNLTRITNPDGSFVSYTYDDRQHITHATDERGNTTVYAYDFAGRFSQSTRPTGETRALTSSKLQGLANTAAGQGTPTNPAPVVRSEAASASLTDGRNNRTTFTLDSLAQIASQTDALGQTTRIERDLNGNPTRITRPNGAIVTMTYDVRGNLLTSTDPVGAATTFTYEPNFNQVTSIRDPRGNTTTISYDARGNPTEIRDASGNRTQMTYDSRGLLTSVTSAVGTPQQNTTSFTYDARGNLLTTTDPGSNTTTLAYDNAGNVTRSTDAEGRVTEFTYDALNRLILVLDPDLRVTRYQYDPKGNLTQVTDARAQRTTFAYDQLGRLLSATNPLNLTETFSYDANGNLTSTTNRNNQSITFDYDALNRLFRKTRPPTSTEVGNQVTTFDYDSVGNLTRVVNPVISIFNQYDLVNRLISSTSSTEGAVSGTVIQINVDTLIDENNRDFDGRSIQVNGRTLTVNGAHTFANVTLINGAVLTHSATTASRMGKLDIIVPGTLLIDTTSRIDVTGKGFLGGGQPGNPFGEDAMTLGFQRGSIGGSGGSYGGLGGTFDVRNVNPVYGDFRDPNDPGSGGSRLNGNGGSGGGLVRIVAQTIQLDGSIVADGGQGFDDGGGASGGGIRVDVGTLRGTGRISAGGGRAGPGFRFVGSRGGGGGGRVALYYQNATAFDVTRISASGADGANNGGAGTVFLLGPQREAGELIVDNGGIVGRSDTTPISTIPAAPLNFTDLKIRRGAKAKVDNILNIRNIIEISTDSALAASDRVSATTIRVMTRSSFDSAIDVSAASIEVTNGSVLGQLPTTGSLLRKLVLNVGTLTVDATSRIDVSGKGFLGGGQPGNTFGADAMTVGFQRGSRDGSGGSYGGLGGTFDVRNVNPVYGDFRDPNDLGSGGARADGNGGSGGGLIRIVAQTYQLDGLIKADGQGGITGISGGGSGGGIRIDVGMLRGTGQITANGGAAGVNGGGGGGGGRVALYYQNATGFDLSRITAFGESGAFNGGAGTIYLQGQGREAGELILDNNNLSAPSLSSPITPSVSGQLLFTHLRVRKGGRARIDDGISLFDTMEVSSGAELTVSRSVVATTINVTNGALVTHLFTTATAFFKVDLRANNLTLDATSRIDGTGRGFLGGGQPDNPFGPDAMTLGFQRGSTNGSGGSYGGLGGAFGGGSANPVYGDFRDPNDPGSGGARFDGNAGSGGGLIRVVAQTFQLDGLIKADGQAGITGRSGGGSGGGLRIDVGILRGMGQITVNGGAAGVNGGGGGGGGRAAVYYQDATAFNLGRVTAAGGSGAVNGQNGTVHLQQQTFIGKAFDIELPVMVAQREPVQLASLETPVIKLRPEPQRMFNLENLTKEMENSLPLYPQRRVFSQLETENLKPETVDSTPETYENRYLALLQEIKESRATSTSHDVDPIYSYDLNGNRTSMIDPTGITTYAYDALNRLISITNNRGLATSFNYDALGRRTSMRHANGIETTYQYDAASQLTRLAHQLGMTTINSFDYTYDRVGNRTSKTVPQGTHSYTYDTLNRLIRAANPLPSNPLETYQYDPVGNRVNSNQNGTSIFNQANQLTEDANFTYQYDANGNLTRKTAKVGGQITSYEYDAENKLARVVTPGRTVNYRHDGLGRRVEKEIIEVATAITRFVYDNEDILLELDGSNNITARYTHGPGIDEPLIMERSGQSFFYQADGLASITELTSSSGTVAQRYTYSSFGKIESQLDPNFVQPYTFTAREFDPETGLHHYRKRTYDPGTGTFLQTDPTGLLFAETNLYKYVRNNPTNFIDPTGNIAFSPIFKLLGSQWDEALLQSSLLSSAVSFLKRASGISKPACEIGKFIREVLDLNDLASSAILAFRTSQFLAAAGVGNGIIASTAIPSITALLGGVSLGAAINDVIIVPITGGPTFAESIRIVFARP